MSNQEKIKTAKEYIDKQMETMRSHGVASKTLGTPAQVFDLTTAVNGVRC